MEGIVEAIAALVVALVELIVVGAQLAVYLCSFLLELLMWGILALQGKKGEKPKFSMPLKKRVMKKALILLGVLVIAGGYFLHQSLFSARISFSSDSIFRLSVGVKYELRSESGRKCVMKGSSDYLTYRWDTIVITDERFGPETYFLTKEDQKIHLKSVGTEKVKEELVNGIKDHLLNMAKDKLNSTLEKE